jgi:hypothetical protein
LPPPGLPVRLRVDRSSSRMSCANSWQARASPSKTRASVLCGASRTPCASGSLSGHSSKSHVRDRLGSSRRAARPGAP